MTINPPELLKWRAYMRGVTGLPDDSLGIKGGPGHVRTGTSYHLGKDQLIFSKNPYSARHPRDKAGLSNAASACDTGWFPRLIELTAWMVDEARAGRRPDTREIIGPGRDGRAYRWAHENNWRADVRPSGDDHEEHAHEGFYRDSEFRDKVGLYKPFFEKGANMAINETDFNAMAWRVEALYNNRKATVGGPLTDEPNALHHRLNELALPVLSDEQLVRLSELMSARLPSVEQIADAVADKLHRRMET